MIGNRTSHMLQQWSSSWWGRSTWIKIFTSLYVKHISTQLLLWREENKRRQIMNKDAHNSLTNTRCRCALEVKRAHTGVHVCLWAFGRFQWWCTATAGEQAWRQARLYTSLWLQMASAWTQAVKKARSVYLCVCFSSQQNFMHWIFLIALWQPGEDVAPRASCSYQTAAMKQSTHTAKPLWTLVSSCCFWLTVGDLPQLRHKNKGALVLFNYDHMISQKITFLCCIHCIVWWLQIQQQQIFA